MTYLRDAMTRIMDMQVQLMDDQGIECKSTLFPDVQNWFPYFANRISATNIDWNSLEINNRVHTVEMLLVVAHLSSDYKPSHDTVLKIYDYIVYVEDFFNENKQLTSDNYPDDCDYLAPEGIELVSDVGLSTFQYAGVPVTQLGVRFTLVLPFIREVF